MHVLLNNVVLGYQREAIDNTRERFNREMFDLNIYLIEIFIDKYLILRVLSMEKQEG